MIKDPQQLLLASVAISLATGWLASQLQSKISPSIKLHTEKLFTFIDNHLLRRMNTEQVVVLSLIGFLTMWITLHPDWALWNSVTQSPQQFKNTMLGVTSITALLTFVTTSVTNAAKEKVDSKTYLNKPISTYIFSESLVSRVLRTPEFSMMVMTIFITPFVVNSIARYKITQNMFTSNLFIISLWCACFAIVSTTLIVALLTLLRDSMIRLLDASEVERKIEATMQRQSASEIRKHFSPLLRYDEFSAGYWIHNRLIELQSIPEEQQVNYITSTLNYDQLSKVINNRISSVNRTFAIERFLSKYKTSYWQLLRKFMRRYSTYILQFTIEVMRSRNVEYIRFLRNPDLDIQLRSRVTIIIINEICLLSNLIAKIKSNKYSLKLKSRALLPEDQLPAPSSIGYIEFVASRPAYMKSRNNTEVFEALTATTFRDLAYLIRNRIGLTCSESSTEYVETIINSTNRISHTATRVYSLNKVIEATMHASVSNLSRGSRLPLRILNEVGLGLENYISRLTDNTAENSHSEVFKNGLEQITLDHVRSAFASYPYMCAEVYSELLDMIPDSDMRPTFLHYLTFNAYQGYRMNLYILSSFDKHLTVPFYYSISKRIPVDYYPKYFRRYLHSSTTGLNLKGLNWLFDILEVNVDYHLYSKYLKLRHDNGLHLRFDTVLLWRIMAGDDFDPVPPVYLQGAIPDIKDSRLERLRDDVKRASKILDDIGKNKEAATLRYSFGVPTPEDIGRSDA